MPDLIERTEKKGLFFDFLGYQNLELIRFRREDGKNFTSHGKKYVLNVYPPISAAYIIFYTVSEEPTAFVSEIDYEKYPYGLKAIRQLLKYLAERQIKKVYTEIEEGEIDYEKLFLEAGFKHIKISEEAKKQEKLNQKYFPAYAKPVVKVTLKKTM